MPSANDSTLRIAHHCQPRRLRILVACVAAVLAITAAVFAAEEPDDSAILARVQLLPVKGDIRSNAFGSRASQPEGSHTAQQSPANPAEAAQETTWEQARTARFPKWVRHEDEFLSFSFPADPRVRLEIKSPKDRIPVAGGPVQSNPATFFRCYRLTFRGETYCLLLLDHSQEFDDSICFCGHVAYDKYLEHYGALYRFSLLENGQIKKIQILGDGLRLALFEWTHMPIHPEVYARIALSAQLRRPVRDLRALQAQIVQTYGKAGFLEKGMDRNAVVALLGPPTSEEPEMLRYVFRQSYDEPPGSQTEEVTWKIPLKDRVFVGLSPDWAHSRALPPDRNSVQWVLAKLDAPGAVTDLVEPARNEELKALLERVVELLPKASPQHWWMLCRAAALLGDRDVKDPRLLRIVKERYLNPQLGAKAASELLEQYDPDGSQELFAKRIRVEMELARKPEALKEQDGSVGWDSLDKLFRNLRPTYPQLDALILEAMDHPHADVRKDGYSLWDLLPEASARSHLVKGLDDPSIDVRMDSANALVEGFGSLEDLALLQWRRAKETDPAAIEVFDHAIERMGGLPPRR